VAQRADLLALDLDGAHVEELEVRHFLAVQLLDDLPGVRALDLEAVGDALDGEPLRVAGRAIVLLDRDAVLARLGVELDPARGRRAPDEDEPVRLQVEQDPVADDVAAVARRNELLGAVDREVREAVDREVGQELHRVRTLDVEVDHVVRLIEEHGGLAPRGLLVTPVREFAGHHRVNVGPDLRVAKQVDGVLGGFEDVL
jgi:hypothetical protein